MTELDKLTMESIERKETLIARMTEVRSILKHSKNRKKFRKNVNAYFKCLTGIYGEIDSQKGLVMAYIGDWDEDNSILSTDSEISSWIRILEAEKRTIETISKLRAEFEKLYIKNQILKGQMN